MLKITATQLGKRTGEMLDLALRHGIVAVTRHAALVAFIVSDVEGLPTTGYEFMTIPATQLWAEATSILDHSQTGECIFTITRRQRPVAHLLPREFREKMGWEL